MYGISGQPTGNSFTTSIDVTYDDSNPIIKLDIILESVYNSHRKLYADGYFNVFLSSKNAIAIHTICQI